MLSIVGIKSSSIESGYYLKQDGGYYIEDTTQKGLYQWMGKGAEKLGLKDAIDEKDHGKVFNGLLPGGIEVGKRNADGTLNGRPGYDLTFSMNKDISLIICCSNDKDLKDYFLEAHINAVKTAMGEVEKMASARKTTSGHTQYVPTKNIIAALCTHFSSRAGDPQIHTHALVANATERPDGKWRALSTDMERKHGFYEKIRDNATYLGHIYQNEMAVAARAKGFELSPVNKHGMFEINHFPAGVRSHFSKRRDQIVKIIDSLKYASKQDKKLYDFVAQHSKATKEKINTVDFLAKSKREMQTYLDINDQGKKFDDIIKVCMQKPLKTPESTQQAKEAIADSTNWLSNFSTKLDANKIIEKAIYFDLGSSSITMLQKALEEAIEAGVLVKTETGHFTTSELLAKEKQLMTFAKQTLKNVTSSTHTTPVNVKQVFSNNRLCIVKEPRTLEDRLSSIDQVIKEFEEDGKKVTLLTQTKSMASSHNEHVRSQATSLWQQLKRIGKADRAQSLHGFLYSYKESTANPLENLFAKKGQEVFIVEDSQRVSIEAAQNLIQLTQKREAKIIFLSSPEGRRSPLAGNALSLIAKAGVPSISMTNQKQLNATTSTSCQIHELKPNINDTNIEKQQHRQQALASHVVKHYANNLAAVQVYSPTQKSAENCLACCVQN